MERGLKSVPLAKRKNHTGVMTGTLIPVYIITNCIIFASVINDKCRFVLAKLKKAVEGMRGEVKREGCLITMFV